MPCSGMNTLLMTMKVVYKKSHYNNLCVSLGSSIEIGKFDMVAQVKLDIMY